MPCKIKTEENYEITINITLAEMRAEDFFPVIPSMTLCFWIEIPGICRLGTSLMK